MLDTTKLRVAEIRQMLIDKGVNPVTVGKIKGKKNLVDELERCIDKEYQQRADEVADEMYSTTFEIPPVATNEVNPINPLDPAVAPPQPVEPLDPAMLMQQQMLEQMQAMTNQMAEMKKELDAAKKGNKGRMRKGVSQQRRGSRGGNAMAVAQGIDVSGERPNYFLNPEEGRPDLAGVADSCKQDTKTDKKLNAGRKPTQRRPEMEFVEAECIICRRVEWVSPAILLPDEKTGVPRYRCNDCIH